MTDPAITAALEKLIADTPPPVTVWGVRYTQQIDGEDADGHPLRRRLGRIHGLVRPSQRIGVPR